MREIETWQRDGGRSPVENDLHELRIRDREKAAKFHALIWLLSKEGDQAVNGKNIIKMKFREIKSPNKIIELKEKPYRLFCILTSTHLWLLEMVHKKDNKLRKEISRLIINRAKTILM